MGTYHPIGWSADTPSVSSQLTPVFEEAEASFTSWFVELDDQTAAIRASLGDPESLSSAMGEDADEPTAAFSILEDASDLIVGLAYRAEQVRDMSSRGFADFTERSYRLDGIEEELYAPATAPQDEDEPGIIARLGSWIKELFTGKEEQPEFKDTLPDSLSLPSQVEDFVTDFNGFSSELSDSFAELQSRCYMVSEELAMAGLHQYDLTELAQSCPVYVSEELLRSVSDRLDE